ncbi:histidine phosphatase family protein [Cellulomonas dongxiuzhuiae]|uniref:Histidine phosphatase family protein n=1 Tax=Cellulomonas dongxiuzhuiae TaxID=2819979 RepID=A0ABX8GKC3_9CELL|nr:histidine phosphatase family protein [Cellulomonas dongxiuzhuiae]MBO3090082.1 histidine phosphatase family protein [Cellulomonas dongxiuzhuiae]MBO3095474.1 histidine phosphatase family protein [Cellulomonas dongxiuzhuiae]QWC16455.1 histidine phosphatase family protein [Cellulomonas dongxiuzhuiae]
MWPSLQSVYLARHGQTEWNVQHRWQGQLDSPLTDLGRVQAQTVASLVADEPVDAVFCSPQGRAAATAQVCGDRLGLPVTPLDELAELHHGSMAGMTLPEMEHAFPGELARRGEDKYRWQFPGGESYEDAVPRAAQALARVASSGAQHPLLVSHEMIGRLLLHHLRRVDIATALAGSHPQGVVYRVQVATGTLTTLGEPASLPPR